MKQLSFIIFLIINLTHPLSAEARRLSKSNQEKEKETAIDTIIVAPFRVRNAENRLILGNRQQDVQKGIIQIINQRSYLAAESTFSEIAIAGAVSELKNLINNNPYSAVLAGEFRSQSLKLSLRRTTTGKTLQTWTLPLPSKLTDQTLKDYTVEIAQTVILGIPFRGFIVDKKGRQVKINLGKAQQIKQGDLLDVFEFEGEKPNYQSNKRKLGQLRVMRIAPQAAITEIQGTDNNIPLFSKVDFPKSEAPQLPEINQKQFDEFWIGIGGDLLFIDTKLSVVDDDLAQREYQLTLTPFLNASLGMGPIAADIQLGSAENASNSVSFLNAQLLYAVSSRMADRFGFVTSLGVGAFSVNSQTKTNAIFPLTKSQTVYPLFEQYFAFVLSERSRVFALGQLQIPKFSSDQVNGNSVPMGSFGFKTALGIRLLLSDSLGVENSINYQFSQLRFAQDKALQEVIFGVNIRAILRF